LSQKNITDELTRSERSAKRAVEESGGAWVRQHSVRCHMLERQEYF
jgi:hypothetical protein